MNENGGDLGGSSGGKSWERSWTTEEMRQNAHTWNLAGDAGLLKHLQEFSQTVLTRTHATEKALDSLVEEINTLTAEANTTNNKFLCLANTQFVENRVYDDDDKETPQDEPVTEKKSKEEMEAKMMQKVREALSMSVAVLDTMFEPVEIQASDSEGESESEKQGTKTLILEPHNPYIHRPLPNLIGSEAFMSDDRIGLGDSPSDGEEHSLREKEDYDMEVSSESDVDFPAFGSTKRTRDVYSSQSSMSDHEVPQEHKKIKPVDPMHNLGDGSEDTGHHASAAASTRQVVQDNDSFAAQLAAKLGKIASPSANSNSNVEKGSIHSKTTSDDLFGGAHSEDEDDALFAGGSGLFAGPPKLFDDLEDTSNSLWGPEKGDKRKPSTSEIEKTEQPEQPVFTKAQTQKFSDNLFSNSMSDDEDDLFSIKSNKSTKTVATGTKPQLESVSSGISKHLKVGDHRPGFATSTPERTSEEENQTQKNADERKSTLFSATETSADVIAAGAGADQHVRSNPSDLSSQNKKPTGGVPMFGQANVLAGLKAKLPRRPSSSSESSTCDAPGSDSNSVPSSQLTNPSGDQPPSASGSADQGWGSRAASSQHSQSASSGFAAPALTSTRLSNDDGYQTKNVSNSISSIPVASNSDSDDDIFSRKSSVPQDSQQISGGLFAEVNDDEDDLFAVSPTIKKEDRKPSSGFSAKTANSNKQVNEDSISSAPTTSKANENSASQTTTKTPTSYLSKSNPQMDFGRNDIYSTVPPPLKSENKVKKPVSLFDDSDSGEDELLFSSASSAGSRRSQASTDILAASAISTVEKKPLAKKGLFDDDDALFGNVRNDPGIDIFGGASKVTSQSNAIMETPPPLSSNSFAEEDSSLKIDSSVAGQNTNVKSSENSDASIPVKPAKPASTKSILQADLFADNVDEDNDDLFSAKLSSAPSIKSVLFPPSESEDTESDLFQDVPKQFQRLQPPSASGSKEEGKGENTVSDVLPSKHSKPSLLVESDNTPRKADKAMHALDSNVGVEKTSLKPESRNEEPIPKPYIQQQHRKPEPPRTLNIWKETDPGLGLIDDSDDDGDLFGSSAFKTALKSEPPPKQPTKPALAVKPENAKGSQPVHKVDSGDLTKTEIRKDSDGKKEENSEVDGAVVSVSKLRDSLLVGGNGQAGLKIDPRALLPGQKPPPRRTPPKEDALSPSLSSESIKPSLVVVGGEQPAGFDRPASNSTTLPSANKDRAKLGVKRRPPSNKARRESARASVNYDQSDRESPLSPDGSSVLTDSISAVNSNNSILSPSTDEDDLFGVPQDLPPEYGNRNVPSTDIFSSAPILSPFAHADSSALPKPGYKKIEPLDKVSEEKVPSSLKVKTPFLLPSETLEKSPSDSLFEPEPELPDKVSSNHLFEQTLGVAIKSSSEDLFAPVPKSNFYGSTSEPSSMSEDHGTKPTTIKNVSEPGFQAAPESSNSMQTNDSQSVDVSHKPAVHTGGSRGDSSLSTPFGNKETTVDTVKDCTERKPVVPPQNDSSNSTALRAARASSDPLNKANLSSVTDDEEFFGSDHTDPGFDDHSSLFPFVKKKPESKPTSNHSLFLQTPALPSKAEKTVSKPDLAGLDDGEDDDLFSSSSKTLCVKKSQDITSALKSKERKTWHFSDEDDDDLFQSGAKSVSSNPSKASSIVSSSISSLSASTESKVPTKPSKLSASNVSVKKLKPAQAAPKNGLFSDENEDDDDLFSKPSSYMRDKAKETPAAQSSLFDDEDDDLFGSKERTSEKNKESKMKNVSDGNAQPPALSKIKKENVFDDPLMALKDDK